MESSILDWERSFKKNSNKNKHKFEVPPKLEKNSCKTLDHFINKSPKEDDLSKIIEEWFILNSILS
ncbi:MAG: hypothetical protein ACTSRZ_09285 [Promethearchaeota archaeon]